MESNQEVVAVANVYDGGKLKELRVATKDLLKSRFNKDFTAEDETQAGEFYIDCVGVDPNQQGKGIGSKIFNFLIEEYVNKRKMPLGLLVDKENPNTKRLYLKLGFQLISEKTLTGKAMEHLQFLPQNNL